MQRLYFEPNARVTITDNDGKSVIFNNINHAVIAEDVRSLGNKATVTLPLKYKELDGKSPLDLIQVGNSVTIEMGNDGVYYPEFTGYLGQIEAGAPLKLHIDDDFYPLKRNSFKKTFEKTSLFALLKYVAPGYDIECSDISLSDFSIINASTYRVLRALQDQYGFYTKIYGNVLRCFWAYDFVSWNKHIYKMGTNVKKNNLKYHREEDVKVKVKGISNLKTGKKIVYETGSIDIDASLRTLNYGPCTEQELKQKVEADYKRFAFNGYSGNIIGFSQPNVHAGDTISIVDEEEPDREGSYLVEKTVITYSLRDGFQRDNTLSYKI